MKQEEIASSEIIFLPTVTQTEEHKDYQSSEKEEKIKSSQFKQEEEPTSHINALLSITYEDNHQISEKEDID